MVGAGYRVAWGDREQGVGGTMVQGAGDRCGYRAQGYGNGKDRGAEAAWDTRRCKQRRVGWKETQWVSSHLSMPL